MKVTVEIGPNKVTRFFSRVRNAIKKGGTGFKNGWKEYSDQKSRDRTTPVKAAA